MKRKQLLVLLVSGVLAMPAMGDTVKLTTATPVGETVEIAISSSSQPKLIWEDGSETLLSSMGQPETVEVKSATFSVESSGSLASIYLPDAALTAIDLSDAPNLEVVYCPNNQLTELDVTGLSKIREIDVQGNAIENLNLSGKANTLESLNCAYNQLTTLRLGTKPYLTTLICAGNELTSLALTAYPTLKTVWCQDNQLTTLSLPRHEYFHSLYAFNNELETLGLSAPSLTSLMVDHNGLQELDLSAATQLEEVDVDHNQLSLITMAESSTSTLTRFYAHENALSYNSFPNIDNITDYALQPQSPYVLGIEPAVGEEFKITSPFVQNAVGDATIFTLNWFDASTGDPLVEDTDFSSRVKGTYTFLKEFPNGVYAEVTSRRYPGITIRTAKMPVGTPAVGIDTPVGAENLTISGGRLTMTVPATTHVRIVSPAGVVLVDKSMPVGTYSWNLNSGVYLVNDAKILIP